MMAVNEQDLKTDCKVYKKGSKKQITRKGRTCISGFTVCDCEPPKERCDQNLRKIPARFIIISLPN